jgi:hypothetical protein
MKRLFVAALLALALAVVTVPARAGNITLTGHDDDFHCADGDPNACTALAALIAYAKGGSSLPVLTFDAGTELTTDLTSLGIAFTNVNPDTLGAVTASLFNNTLYSAFIVASDFTCGGCDNDPTGEAAIAAQSAAIDSFLNAGGGIVGLAGADSSGYYSFVPQTATSVGGAPSTGYSQTSVGAGLGIPAVNGDETHNLFFDPGTHGESAFYQIDEVNAFGNGTILPPAAATLSCTECTVSGGVIVGGGGGTGVTPEPSTLVLFGTGLTSFAGLVRRRFTR